MQPSEPIRIKNLRIGTATTTDELHLTGGIRGFRVEGGWVISPILIQNRPVGIGPIPAPHLLGLCRELGIEMFGADEIDVSDSELRIRRWQPFIRAQGLRPEQKWAGISYAALQHGDSAYSKLARNLSASLRAADIRLRDASDEYNRQLRAALKRDTKPGRRFQNIALTDLYLAFHSLLAEMASARDYFAAIAGRHIGASDDEDSLPRLMKWTDAASRQHLRTNPLVAPLAAGWEAGTQDRWLYDLGEYRNRFLHREPMSAGLGGGGAIISERICRHGQVRTLRVEIPAHSDSSDKIDALERFLYLYRRLLELVGRMADQARYPVEFQHFVIDRGEQS